MAATAPVHAQTFTETFFTNITDLSITASCWNVRSDALRDRECAADNVGYGLELMWRLTSPEGGSPWLAEFGLGYSQSQRFASADPTMEIRGTARELPAVSVYGTYLRAGRLQPFVGIRSGLIQLQNVQLADRVKPDTVLSFTGTAQALQAGVAVGASFQLQPRLFLVAEGGYHLRRFPSVQWAAGQNTRTPTRYPRELDFSGFSWSAGVQARLGKKQDP